MEKYLNELSLKINAKIKKGFKASFPLLKIFVGICNTIIVITGGIILLSAIIMYIVPKFHTFLDALKNIFNVHTVFGAAIVLGALMVVIGAFGVYFLFKGSYDKLGLQAATFLLLLIIMSALTFTFWIEWESNAHFGISYATQSFNPRGKDAAYFTSIQKFMLCCGSTGPADYDIANENFMFATAPLCCCNHLKYPEYCSNITRRKDDGKLPLAISVHKAFKTGCMNKMENVIWPIIIYIIFIQSGLSFICMLTSAIVIMGYQAYIKPKCSHSKKDSKLDLSKLEFEEPLTLETKN